MKIAATLSTSQSNPSNLKTYAGIGQSERLALVRY